jgi:hypothetical protein
VVEISLLGGGQEIVTQRNDVRRFSKADANRFVSRLNESFETARERGDPFCYTDQSKAFGPRSLLLEQLGGKERIVPVGEARARLYDRRFSARYARPGHWYAPLLYLRGLTTGEPVAVLDTVLLLSDPLKLGHFLENWMEAGIHVSDYETMNILTDAEFDEFMRWIEARGWAAIIDPVLNPSDGTLVSGLPIRSLESVLSDPDPVD